MAKLKLAIGENSFKTRAQKEVVKITVANNEDYQWLMVKFNNH